MVRRPAEPRGAAHLQCQDPGLPVTLEFSERLPGDVSAGLDPDVGDQQDVPPTAIVRSTWCSSIAAAKAGAAM